MIRRRIDFVELAAFGGACLFIICLYTSPATLYPVLEPLRPAMPGANLMIGGVLARRIFRGAPVAWGGAVGPAMITVFGLAALSWFWAFNPGDAIAFFLEAVKLVAAYVGIVGALNSPARIRKVMVLAALVSIVPAWGTIQRYNAGIDLVEGFRGAWIGLLANPNQLAMVMAVTMPWTLTAALGHKGLLRFALLGALALECACVVVTHSRGGALGMGMAFLAFALFSKNKARSLLVVAVAAAFVAVLAPKSFWQRNETIAAYQYDASAMGRIKSWETGFAAVSEHPLLGIGAGGYTHAWDRYQPRNIREKAYASHNMWMQVLVELGLLGITAFAAMFLLMLRGLWRAKRNPEYENEARALLASFTALVVCGTTGGYAFNWFFYMALGVAGAVVAGARRATAQEQVHGLGVAVA